MAKDRTHPHSRPDELYAFSLPANSEAEMGIVVLPNDANKLARHIGATHMYILHEELALPSLECGCPLAMAVNYDSLTQPDKFELNPRASLFINDGFIKGDVLIVAQGMVQFNSGVQDIDFISLTPQFHEWKGAGHPVPAPTFPWHR